MNSFTINIDQFHSAAIAGVEVEVKHEKGKVYEVSIPFFILEHISYMPGLTQHLADAALNNYASSMEPTLSRQIMPV